VAPCLHWFLAIANRLPDKKLAGVIWHTGDFLIEAGGSGRYGRLFRLRQSFEKESGASSRTAGASPGQILSSGELRRTGG